MLCHVVEVFKCGTAKTNKRTDSTIRDSAVRDYMMVYIPIVFEHHYLRMILGVLSSYVYRILRCTEALLTVKYLSEDISIHIL